MEHKGKPIKWIEGYTESLWKSLLVKSIRLGWPEGIRQAEKRLSASTVKGIAICQVFEDIWPLEHELPQILDQINRRDWEALCAWETHHGLGITDDYQKYEKDAVLFSKNNSAEIYELAKKFNVWLTFRAMPEFALWRLSYKDIKDPKPKREIDLEPWEGMPIDCADMHTFEGKRRKTFETILSGNVGGHIRLKNLVKDGGWKYARSQVHKAGIIEPDPEHLNDFGPARIEEPIQKPKRGNGQKSLAAFMVL